MSPGASPGRHPGATPGVTRGATRGATQRATSRKPAYHPRHYGLLTRVSLGTPRVVARNAADRWLECWWDARVIVRVRSVSDDVSAIDVVAVVYFFILFYFFAYVIVVVIICRKRFDAWY